MNIRRFGWPVIIAASLHGALFLISSEPGTRPPGPPGILIPVVLPPLPEPPFTAEPDEPLPADPGGPVSHCILAPLRLPETVAVDRLHTFTVPVEPTVPPAETVYRLEGIAGLPAGPGSEIGGRGTPRLLPVGELDRIPRTVFRRTPSYPEPERRDGIAGAVTVEFVVDTAGRVLRAEAVAWTRREFVEPSVRAVQDWRFEPGTVRGRKVSFRMAVPIEFTATP